MKKINLVAIALILGFLWWHQYKEDKAFMDSLLLHQPIERDQVQIARMWEANKSEEIIQNEELNEIISWFNDYPPNKIEEQSRVDRTSQNSNIKAEINIALKSGYKIKILFVSRDSIYVTRTDIKGGMQITYSFLDDAPKLERYFEEYLEQ
ncbi:hypothetical protein [Pontibacillus marinus]|uniref:Uncharacterized protein n=1 Tax=Pontibacillus marinus BH030004 = DSM 16465 TaxID=1385511 RepID=A0A0A5I2S8_9BACI|nr:hypothetical protein [Pontibacillus marinus]KGX90152.1 hypothetical protein N783_01285 [Pontibacillus marinus BH030004 = DSM 16465]